MKHLPPNSLYRPGGTAGLGTGIDISHYGAPYKGMLGVGDSGDGLGSYVEQPGFDYEYATAGMGEMLYRYGAALGVAPWTGKPSEDPRMVKKFTKIVSTYRVRNLGSEGNTASKAADTILSEARRAFSGNTVRKLGGSGWGSGALQGKVGYEVILAQPMRAGEIKQKNFQAGKKAQSRMSGTTWYDATTQIPSNAFVDAPPETPPTPEETPSTTPQQDAAETPFYSKKVAGLPVWALGLMGTGLVVGVGYMVTRQKSPAVTPNRRRRRRRRRTSRRR